MAESPRVYCKKGVVIVEPLKRTVRLRLIDSTKVKLTPDEARQLILNLAWAVGELDTPA